TEVDVPEHALTGQLFALTYTVVNAGAGDTPPAQGEWDDLIYLSRDPFLDLQSDRYLDFVHHSGGLAAGDSHSVPRELRAPRDLTGPFFVFVVTDPVRFSSRPRGDGFEGDGETTNATPSPRPLLLDEPPPSDLQVDAVAVPAAARSGDI